jgi:hypothetical protein
MTRIAFTKNRKNIFKMNIALLIISSLATLLLSLTYYQDIELPIKHKVLNLLVLLCLTLIPFVTALCINLKNKKNLNRLAIALNCIGIFIAIFLFSNQFYNQLIFFAFLLITSVCLINIRNLSLSIK